MRDLFPPQAEPSKDSVKLAFFYICMFGIFCFLAVLGFVGLGIGIAVLFLHR